jgi:hypothetical protein
MKNRQKIARGRGKNARLASMANDFVRGFVSYALVAAVEDLRRDKKAGLALLQPETLRTSTLYGAALVAGVAAGNAVERRDYVAALAAIAGGAAGAYALNRLISYASTPKE